MWMDAHTAWIIQMNGQTNKVRFEGGHDHLKMETGIPHNIVIFILLRQYLSDYDYDDGSQQGHVWATNRI